MGLILDTSAVIGWVEHQHTDLVRWLREGAGEEVPHIHTVTLGELERGVLEAPDNATKVQREATLRFVRDELRLVSFADVAEQAHLFGVVSSAVSRKVSHNDCWITAAALGTGDTLVTMDHQLTDQLAAAAKTETPLSRWLRMRHRNLDVKHIKR